MTHSVICRRCNSDITHENNRLVVSFSGGWTNDEFIVSEYPLNAVLCYNCAHFLTTMHRFIYELLEPHRTDDGGDDTRGC